MTQDPFDAIASLPDLDAVRAGIDALDDRLIPLLALRQAHADRAAALKADLNIAAAAPSRVAAVLTGVRARAEAAGFDPDTAAAMWQVMIDALIAREEKVLGTGGEDK